jgi:uncharacterized protein DUF2842
MIMGREISPTASLRQGAEGRSLPAELGKPMGFAMKIRARKFVGTIATVSFLTVYCLVAMVIGNAIVARHVGSLGEAAFFVIAGLAWLPPAMLLVRWMQRPDP